MEGEGHRISAAALRNRGLIRTSGRGATWSAKLTPAGEDYLARLHDRSGAVTAAEDLPPVRYHPVVRLFRDLHERHEVARGSLARAVRIAQTLVTGAQARGWLVKPAGESENSYGMLDWTGAKDGHLEVEARGQTLRVRIHEEGVHARGRWEQQVARFADVPADSPQRREAPLPAGDYDASSTGRLKLELLWGPWWTRQQTRWADAATVPLEDRIPEVLDEIERRAAVEVERSPAGDAVVLSALTPTSGVRPERIEEQLLDEQFGTLLGDQARRWEQAERVRRYLDAVESTYGEHALTAEWIARGRAYADRLDPLRDLWSHLGRSGESGLADSAALD